MSKGSKRRPGKGYEENWDRIFGKNKTVDLISLNTEEHNRRYWVKVEEEAYKDFNDIAKNHTQEYVIKNTPESV